MQETTSSDSSVESIMEKLLTLPPEQRVALGEQLIDSVPPDFSADTIAEWRSRLEDIKAGNEEGASAETVFAEIEQALDEAGQNPRKGAPTTP